MNIVDINGYTLNNLNKINILLGKNGCGKSTLLRKVEEKLSSKPETYGKSKYITPERGGSLVYEAGVEQNLTNDDYWLPGQRRRNQTTNFRQQSIAQYKKLELLVLREIETEKRSDDTYNFNIFLDKINTLLDYIEIRRDETTFKIYKKGTDEQLRAEDISSGESELISLGIECLVFSKECVEEKENFLYLDEPDVHLHPDLQVRLIYFLKDLVSQKDSFKILIATHSTAILGALESYSDTHLAFLSSNQTEVDFHAISEVYKKVLPVFGAHPLSNIFNQAPILLVEGEDDERIWQQAVRTSDGAINIYPCSVDSVTNINDFELETQKIIQNVYDSATGYSLRDKDETEDGIEDLTNLIRMKLSCRNAENLLLSDEVLASLSTDWDSLKNKIQAWLSVNGKHTHYPMMKKFQDGGFDRKHFNIKEIRNDLVGIMASSRPWEITVGKVIASLVLNNSSEFISEGKIFTFLGEKVVRNLIPKNFTDN